MAIAMMTNNQKRALFECEFVFACNNHHHHII